MKSITSYPIGLQNTAGNSSGASLDTEPSFPAREALPFLLWVFLSSLLLIPLFLSSTIFIGRDGFHGIQVGIDNRAIIHGYQLTCAEATEMRQCSMLINGQPLKITAPLLNQSGPCTATYAGKNHACAITKVVGEQQQFPPETKRGILITGEEIEQILMADQANWGNWRSLFLGVGRETSLLNLTFMWFLFSFFLSFLFLPLFSKLSALSRVLVVGIASVIASPFIYAGLFVMMVLFGFML